MSTVAEGLAALDLQHSRRIPLSRLIRVELRKMADTRAGMWLLIGICVLTAAVMTIFLVNADEADRTFMKFMGAAATPQSALLPVLGILLITSEWTQRTALVTFTLEPVRSRVLAAKLFAALLFGLAAVIVALIIATGATAVGGHEVAWNDVGALEIGKFGLLQASSILQGLAFGMVILNSSGAIATFFILPTAMLIATSAWSVLADAGPWIVMGTATQPLTEVGALSSTDWAHLGVASCIWIVVPLAAGLFRVLHKEVK